MTVWFQGGARFIEPQVSIGAQSQNGQIDGPLGLQFQMDSVTFLLEIGWIRGKGYLVLPGNPQGIQQVLSQKMFTGMRMHMGNASPFIQFNYS